MCSSVNGEGFKKKAEFILKSLREVTFIKHYSVSKVTGNVRCSLYMHCLVQEVLANFNLISKFLLLIRDLATNVLAVWKMLVINAFVTLKWFIITDREQMRSFHPWQHLTMCYLWYNTARDC